MKGEKGTPVFFWKFTTYEDEKTGEKKQSVTVRTYYVFNIAQCEGVKTPKAPVPRTEPERIAAAEALLAATGANVQFGGSQAYYAPGPDVVVLPPRAAFKSVDGFYSTAFHEVGHWTGHPSRLNREFGKRFGDDAYAFEELVAELTTALVCASEGFVNEDRPDHAAYLKHWLGILKGDNRAFITAAGAAQKAADFILSAAVAAEDGEAEGGEEVLAQAA